MFQLGVPALEGTDSEINIRSGEVLYVVGANGSGKSSLLHRWRKLQVDAEIIMGNREVTFSSSAAGMSPSEMVTAAEFAKNEARRGTSRFRKGFANDVK